MEVLHYQKRTSNHQTRRVDKKKEFAVAVLDLEHKTFIVHVVILSVDSGDEVHPSKRAQIVHLKVNDAPIEVSIEYTNFADIFLPKLAVKLLEHGISNHAIEFVNN